MDLSQVCGRCRFGSLHTKVMLLVEQGQGSYLLIVEALQEGRARCKFVVQTIKLVSHELAQDAGPLYHALIVAWDSICEHSIAKLVKAVCWIAFRTLL